MEIKMKKNPELCFSCKVCGECPVLDWGWVQDIEELYSNSSLPLKPKVVVSITACDEYVENKENNNHASPMEKQIEEEAIKLLAVGCEVGVNRIEKAKGFIYSLFKEYSG